MRAPDGNNRFLAIFLAFLSVFLFASGTSWAATQFVSNGDGTVTDTKTGLMWQQADSGAVRNWDQANAYCESLVLPSSHSDWRLPRIDELETIVDYSRYHPTIDPVFSTSFSTSGEYDYWSSSTSVGDQDYAWYVGFSNGNVHVDDKPNYYANVRCVRGGPFWPFDTSDHLETPIGKPDTVLDTYWGYMWQKGDSGDTNLTWDQAKAYCDGLVLDGYRDWRLPEIEALLTIVDYTRFIPALSTIFDPRRPYYYWSSSTRVYYPDKAWGVDLFSGHVSAHYKTDDYYVRCVRGGPW